MKTFFLLLNYESKKFLSRHRLLIWERKAVKAIPSKTIMPILLVAYKRNKAKERVDETELEKELAALTYDINAYRCLDCSSINRVSLSSFFINKLPLTAIDTYAI